MHIPTSYNHVVMWATVNIQILTTTAYNGVFEVQCYELKQVNLYLLLADFNFVISTPSAKLPNLTPCQISRYLQYVTWIKGRC